MERQTSSLELSNLEFYVKLVISQSLRPTEIDYFIPACLWFMLPPHHILFVKIVKFAEFIQLGGQLMRFITYLKTHPPASDSSKILNEKLIINFTLPNYWILLYY